MGDEPRRATAAATDVIVREIRVRARPEAIWAFLVEPENLKRWKGVEVELDVRPGGVRRVDIHGGRDIATGEHVVVEPYGRLVFTWGWEGNEQLPPGSSTVEVTLTPDGDETVVLLEHRDLPTPQDRAMHGAGWCTAWPSRRRAVAVAGGDPDPDHFMDRAQ